MPETLIQDLILKTLAVQDQTDKFSLNKILGMCHLDTTVSSVTVPRQAATDVGSYRHDTHSPCHCRNSRSAVMTKGSDVDPTQWPALAVWGGG